MANPQKNPTAAILIIGDEILSGRTQDINIQYIALNLGKLGIDLKEVRVVPDIKQKISDAVNEQRRLYRYVFTTGGIGPTHDDITAESIAYAFGVELVQDKKAYLLLEEYYGAGNLNEGRIKMSYVPYGAELIDNPVTIAPGFKMDNVFVLAGVPKIMQSMFESTIPYLEKGVEVQSIILKIDAAESKIADEMSALQKKYPEVTIGSYPFMKGDTYNFIGVHVVLRGTDYNLVDKVAGELESEIEKLNFAHERVAA